MRPELSNKKKCDTNGKWNAMKKRKGKVSSLDNAHVESVRNQYKPVNTFIHNIVND